MKMGKRLQERTKDEKKQRHFVSHVNLCFRNIFLHIPPTVDVWLVSSAFVLLRVTAETQRSAEKAERAMQTAQYHQGTVGTTLVSLKAVNRRQNVFQLWSVFKQYKSFCLPNSGLWCLFCFISCFFFNCLLAHQCFCMNVSRPADVRPSVSLPQVRGNSIRMDKSDMSQVKDD